MNFVALLDDAVPGPACLIPEDKKIFRVSAETTDAVPFGPALRAPSTADGDGVPALPVPHMYSA
jgi:hypothetical protein